VVTAGWGSAIAPEAAAAGTTWTVGTYSTAALRIAATRLLPAVSTSLVSNATEKGTAAYFDGKPFDTDKFLWDSGRDALIYSLFKPIPTNPATAGEVAAKETFHQAFTKAALAQGIKTPAVRVLAMKLVDPTVLPIALKSGQQIYDAYTLPLDPKDPKSRNRI